MQMMRTPMQRRELLKSMGGLVVGFSLAGTIRSTEVSAAEAGDYGPPEDQVNSWIAISEDGHATLFSGCCELGTGSSTGLLQVMAEELDMPFARVRLVLPDTDRTPDQFVSSGSRTISAHSRPIRIAAAEARAALIDLAAQRLGIPADRLITRDGAVVVQGRARAKDQLCRTDRRQTLQCEDHRKSETKIAEGIQHRRKEHPALGYSRQSLRLVHLCTGPEDRRDAAWPDRAATRARRCGDEH